MRQRVSPDRHISDGEIYRRIDRDVRHLLGNMANSGEIGQIDAADVRWMAHGDGISYVVPVFDGQVTVRIQLTAKV